MGARTPCSDPPCDTDGTGEPCDRHEQEAAHAEGEHAFCGLECEPTMPSEQMRNAILWRAIPGSRRMLAEPERRAAVSNAPDVITLNRSQLAALLAHHADVLAAQWWTTAPGAAVLSLRDHANDLTAEKEAPAVAELLDSIIDFHADGTRGGAAHPDAQDGEMSASTHPLPEMFGGLNRLLGTSSRDWAQAREDAWLYGLMVGWDCEDSHEHDDLCNNGAAMDEMVAKHGWSPETVARLRSYRAAVRAATGDPFPDPRFASVKVTP